MKIIKTAFQCLFLFIIAVSLTGCKDAPILETEQDSENEVSTHIEMEATPVVIPPIIDGTIVDHEWQDAEVRHFSEGSEIYFLIHEGDLYLAIRNIHGGMIAGNVFLEQEGQVLIMHSSAALGTAIYQNDGDEFHKIKDFEWCCRSKIDDEASKSAREKFNDEEGWLGSNSFIGAENELEYLISLEGISARLAVNFILADGGAEKQVWPVGLVDGVAQPTPGGFPDMIDFTLEYWIPLEDFQ